MFFYGRAGEGKMIGSAHWVLFGGGEGKRLGDREGGFGEYF